MICDIWCMIYFVYSIIYYKLYIINYILYITYMTYYIWYIIYYINLQYTHVFKKVNISIVKEPLLVLPHAIVSRGCLKPQIIWKRKTWNPSFAWCFCDVVFFCFYHSWVFGGFDHGFITVLYPVPAQELLINPQETLLHDVFSFLAEKRGGTLSSQKLEMLGIKRPVV